MMNLEQIRVLPAHPQCRESRRDLDRQPLESRKTEPRERLLLMISIAILNNGPH